MKNTITIFILSMLYVAIIFLINACFDKTKEKKDKKHNRDKQKGDYFDDLTIL